jgi:WD40 repeat protein
MSIPPPEKESQNFERNDRRWFWSVKWHPTKNKLAISVQDGLSKSTILNLDNDESIELDSITNDGARAIGWNHSGNLLAVGDYDGYLTIFDEKGRILFWDRNLIRLTEL